MLIPDVVMPFSLLLKLNLSAPAHLQVNSKKNSVGIIFLLKLLSIAENPVDNLKVYQIHYNITHKSSTGLKCPNFCIAILN